MTGDDVDPRVERTRERVHAAVHELLVEDGLHGVTHTRVAQRSGVGRATVYRHWPELPDLLADALRAHQHHVTGPGTGLDVDDLAAVAAHVAEAFGRALRSDPMVPVMLGMLERAERDPAYAVARASLARTGGQILTTAVLRARELGRVPDDSDPDLLKASLVGPLFFARFVLDRPFSSEEVAAHVAGWLRSVGYDATVSDSASDR